MEAFAVAVRWLHFCSASLLVGAFAFPILVARPAATAAGLDDPETLAPLDRRLAALGAWALRFTLASGFLDLWRQTTVATGLGLGESLAPAALGSVLLGTRYGTVWLVRQGLLVLLAALLLLADPVRDALQEVRLGAGPDDPHHGAFARANASVVSHGRSTGRASPEAMGARSRGPRRSPRRPGGGVATKRRDPPPMTRPGRKEGTLPSAGILIGVTAALAWLALVLAPVSGWSHAGGLVVPAGAGHGGPGTPPPLISAPDLKAQLDSAPRPLLVDLRPPDEFRRGHVPGARSIPLRELRRRAVEIPRGRLVLYCGCPGDELEAAIRGSPPMIQGSDRTPRDADFGHTVRHTRMRDEGACT